MTVRRDSPGIHVQLRCSERSRPTGFRIDSYPDHGHLDHRDLIKGSFTYVPLTGYVGTDTMTFQGIQNGHISRPATVSYRVS